MAVVAAQKVLVLPRRIAASCLGHPDSKFGSASPLSLAPMPVWTGWMKAYGFTRRAYSRWGPSVPNKLRQLLGNLSPGLGFKVYSIGFRDIREPFRCTAAPMTGENAIS